MVTVSTRWTRTGKLQKLTLVDNWTIFQFVEKLDWYWHTEILTCWHTDIMFLAGFDMGLKWVWHGINLMRVRWFTYRRRPSAQPLAPPPSVKGKIVASFGTMTLPRTHAAKEKRATRKSIVAYIRWGWVPRSTSAGVAGSKKRTRR